MAIPYIIKIENERITFSSADGKILAGTPCIIALNAKDEVLAVGQTQQELQEKSPQEWENLKDQVHFCNPISPDYFHPEHAVEILDFNAYHVLQEINWRGLLKPAV